MAAEATRPTTSADASACFANSVWRPLRRNQAAMPATTKRRRSGGDHGVEEARQRRRVEDGGPEVVQLGARRRAPRSRPASAARSWRRGSRTPRASRRSRPSGSRRSSTPFETRSRPNRKTPRKVDSRKKASRPSAASGAPKMSPTNREYSAQLVPNWNSMMMPVATPMAKVVVKSLIQKFGGRHVGRDAALVVAPLGEHDHQRQPDADGHEDEVVADGEGELDAGQHQSVHAWWHLLGWRMSPRSRRRRP